MLTLTQETGVWHGQAAAKPCQDQASSRRTSVSMKRLA
jgi:hypothetical protein